MGDCKHKWKTPLDAHPDIRRCYMCGLKRHVRDEAMERDMVDLCDRLAMNADAKIDLRAWRMLLTYVPAEVWQRIEAARERLTTEQ